MDGKKYGGGANNGLPLQCDLLSQHASVSIFNKVVSRGVGRLVIMFLVGLTQVVEARKVVQDASVLFCLYAWSLSGKGMIKSFADFESFLFDLLCFVADKNVFC